MLDFGIRHRANCQARQLRITKDGREVVAVLAYISPLAQLDQTSTPLHTFRAIGHQQSGDGALAEADMAMACRVNPYHAVSLIAYATILHNTGRHFIAADYRERAVAIAGNIEHILKRTQPPN
uniref:Uncharacterized protein n=2 Tax=viral metagenome TaxID=1070528 RepID=A0A6M3K3D7_9ZZZZ